MLKIQKYILSEWAKVFGMTACLVMGLIIVQEVYSKLNDLIAKGGTFWEILLSLSLTIPHFLPAVIPLILLLSVLFSVGAMHRKNEITAMKAAGMSLWKLSFPLYLAAFVCAAGILYLNASLIPWSVQKQSDLKRQIYLRGSTNSGTVTTAKDRIVSNLGVLNFRDNRLWLIGTYHPYERRAEEITVYEMNESGRELYRVRAKSASYQGDKMGWLFHDGNALYFDGKTDEPYRNQSFDQLAKEAYSEDPELMLALRRKPQDLSLYELRKILNEYEGYDAPEIIPYKVRFYRILAAPFSCFLVVGFGVPFAVGGVRTNPMVGISKAFGMFLVYFVVSNLATIFGEGGWISPMLAAAIPLAFVGIIATRVFLKAQ